jgi:hypothetical protein
MGRVNKFPSCDANFVGNWDIKDTFSRVFNATSAHEESKREAFFLIFGMVRSDETEPELWLVRGWPRVRVAIRTIDISRRW